MNLAVKKYSISFVIMMTLLSVNLFASGFLQPEDDLENTFDMSEIKIDDSFKYLGPQLVLDMIPYSSEQNKNKPRIRPVECFNFVLIVPFDLPAEWQMIHDSYSKREEKPPYNLQNPDQRQAWSDWSGIHNSSFKFSLQNSAGALVRCKQFLYDLGPLSNSDHGALYDHYHWRMKHKVLGNRVYWQGYDYDCKPALTFQDSRTNVELRVVSGNVSADELIQLAEHLKCQATSLVKGLTYAEYTYWSRYPRYDQNLYMPNCSYKVPSSLWKLRWPLWETDHSWKKYCDAMVSSDMTRIISVISRFGLKPDSSCVFGEPENPLERQIFLTHVSHPHLHGWLRQIQADKSPLKQPLVDRYPEMDSFSGFSSFLHGCSRKRVLRTPLYI